VLNRLTCVVGGVAAIVNGTLTEVLFGSVAVGAEMLLVKAPCAVEAEVFTPRKKLPVPVVTLTVNVTETCEVGDTEAVCDAKLKVGVGPVKFTDLTVGATETAPVKPLLVSCTTMVPDELSTIEMGAVTFTE